MAQPSNASVTIDGQKFNAISVHFGIETHNDDFGMPMMGSLRTIINCTVDIHDTKNMPFTMLRTLFELANKVTRDKIKTIRIEFWQDDSQQDAICTYTFLGWLSAFHTSGGGGINHVLDLRIVPALDKLQFISIAMAN